jgi:hypothetical protein
MADYQKRGAPGLLLCFGNRFVLTIEADVEISYDVPVPLGRNWRVASVRAEWRTLVKLFRKAKSKFYWYDFTVRGHRYRGSTQETK